MKRGLAVLGLVTMLAACGQFGAVEAEVVFPGPVDTRPGAAVLLEGRQVGEVLSVDGNRIRIRVSAKERSAVSSAAVVLPASGGSLALRNPPAAGDPIRDGQQLRGLAGSEWERLARELTEALGSAIEEFSTSLDQYLASDDWRQRKQRIRDQLGSLGEEADRSLGELANGFAQFLEDLETDNREDLRRQQQRMKALAAELRADLDRARGEGQAALAEALRTLQKELAELEEQLERPRER
ncbi:MAG: hypothetical protein LJE84_04415 [Gammaproteobacteria bacterium]|jgi:hypothetical protein|nr:hypothetical protein [Gammaproteobacteria bacterium]